MYPLMNEQMLTAAVELAMVGFATLMALITCFWVPR